MSTHLEVEAKYDVAPDQPLPDLVGAAGVAATVAKPEVELAATYFDTDDQALGRARVTLRRRVGGSDEGWHLKLPVEDGGRLEVRRPLGRPQRPPVALTELLRGVVGSARLVPVATLTTRRAVHDVVDARGLVLAELADDRVVGERANRPPLTWREVEVELVDGDRDVLAGLDAVLRAGGLVPATSASKVSRVLADDRPAEPERLRRRTPAVDVSRRGLESAIGAVVGADPLARLDRPGAPALLRDGLRRLRAGVAIHRQLAPHDAADTLRDELIWAEGVVAALDEIDTALLRIRAGLAAAGDVPDDLTARVERDLATPRRAALRALRAALKSPRYLAVLDAARGLVAHEPDGPVAGLRAGSVLPDLVDRAVRRAERRLDELGRAQSDEERRWLLARALRGVERAAYVERLERWVTASDIDALAVALDEAAGELSDLEAGRLARLSLRAIAAKPSTGAAAAFVLGRLDGRESSEGDRGDRAVRRLRRQLRRLRRAR